jgi:hypothetical protein
VPTAILGFVITQKMYCGNQTKKPEADKRHPGRPIFLQLPCPGQATFGVKDFPPTTGVAWAIPWGEFIPRSVAEPDDSRHLEDGLRLVEGANVPMHATGLRRMIPSTMAAGCLNRDDKIVRGPSARGN